MANDRSAERAGLGPPRARRRATDARHHRALLPQGRHDYSRYGGRGFRRGGAGPGAGRVDQAPLQVEPVAVQPDVAVDHRDRALGRRRETGSHRRAALDAVEVLIRAVDRQQQARARDQRAVGAARRPGRGGRGGAGRVHRQEGEGGADRAGVEQAVLSPNLGVGVPGAVGGIPRAVGHAAVRRRGVDEELANVPLVVVVRVDEGLALVDELLVRVAHAVAVVVLEVFFALQVGDQASPGRRGGCVSAGPPRSWAPERGGTDTEWRCR